MMCSYGLVQMMGHDSDLSTMGWRGGRGGRGRGGGGGGRGGGGAPPSYPQDFSSAGTPVVLPVYESTAPDIIHWDCFFIVRLSLLLH
jgi:hypothetical protein